jgi:glucose 1-dehydrogenase
MRLSGKIALITGASQGIGRGIALRFAQEGADVAINYRKEQDLAAKTVAEIQALGRRAVAIQADVSQVAQIARLVDEAIRQLGRLDILVNNAGVEFNAAFWDQTEQQYDTVLDVNLKGPFFASQAFVRHLRAEQRPGKIINISSVHEELPFPNFTPYCASKGGMKMMTRNLAIELGPLGITVNAIAPGAIETQMNSALLRDPAKLNPLLGQIPLGRIGQPEDVAGVAAFLASSDADYVTGSTYFVDGGLTWDYHEQ